MKRKNLLTLSGLFALMFLLLLTGCGQDPEEAFNSATEQFKADYLAGRDKEKPHTETPNQKKAIDDYEKAVNKITQNLSAKEKSFYQGKMNNVFFMRDNDLINEDIKKTKKIEIANYPE